MTVYFFGVWPNTRFGHHFYLPGGGKVCGGEMTPWSDDNLPIVGGVVRKLMGSVTNKHDYGSLSWQVEGVRHYDQRDGWTMVGWWDRSEDKTSGSCSVFALHAEFTADEAEAKARAFFPYVFARMDRHLGRVTPKPVEAPVVPGDLLRRFSLHAIDGHKAMLHKRICEAVASVDELVFQLEPYQGTKDVTCDLVNERCLALAQLIVTVCPDNQERAQAIDALAMARMLLHEVVIANVSNDHGPLSWADRSILEARLLACESVTLGAA